MKNKISIVITMLILTILVVGCSNDDTNSSNNGDESDLIKIRMGVQPWVGNGPSWIAEEKGFDEKHGLKIETVSFEEDADVNAALASNDVQVANLATHTTIRLKSSHDLDPVSIIYIDESLEADAILASGDLTTIKDLKGEKIAFEEGTTSELLLQQALTESGMTLDDIEPVFMPASQAGLAMISGDVDVAVTYAPYIDEAVERKKSEGVHLLYSGKDSPGLISDLVVLKEDFLEEEPDVKEKLRAVWEESLQFWRDNEEEGNEIVANGSGTTAEEISPVLEGLKFYNNEEQKEKYDSGEIINVAEDIQSLMLGGGSIEKEINVEEIFDLD